MIIRVLGPLLALSVIGNLTFFWLWQGAREDVIEEREGCNVANLEAALAASQAAQLADNVNHKREIQQMLELVESSRRARDIAEEAAELAKSRAGATKTIIRRVADTDACLNAEVPNEILDSLR